LHGIALHRIASHYIPASGIIWIRLGLYLAMFSLFTFNTLPCTMMAFLSFFSQERTCTMVFCIVLHCIHWNFEWNWRNERMDALILISSRDKEI